ncbi:MAG TPA: P-loop NTPase [Desulfuromonadaceae bacterium]|jgi:nitrogenase iron protein NifH
MTHHIALYGKGGVGKTTLATNVSAALVEAGFSVMLIGCGDGDSCTLLNGGIPISGILDQIRSQTAITLESIVHTGFKGISCVELGRSANSGAHGSDEVSKAFTELKRINAFEQIYPDYVFYDFSGDSLSASLRAVMSQVEINRLFVVTTADFKALQAANDAFGFLEQYNGESSELIPMGGLILNSIASSFEEAFVNDFAYHTNARKVGKVPRSLVVRQCELYGNTVIESRPQSNQSYYYRRLANQIVDATGAIYSGNLPQPMSAERLRAWSLEWADRIYALENGLVTDGEAI